jgi:hypothetical protein
MKKLITVITVGLFFLGSFTACQQSSHTHDHGDATDSTSQDMAKAEYTCSMHPDVVSDKPGKCPQCGMDLVKKDSTEHSH